MAALYEVHLGRIQFGDSNDERPLIVVRGLANGCYRVAMVSGNLDLYVERRDFLIDSSHPDFAATGLPRASYAFGGYAAEVSSPVLERQMGELVGNLRGAFGTWWDFWGPL